MSTVEYDIQPSVAGGSQAAEPVRAGDVESLRPLPRISVHSFCESEQMLRLMEACGRDRRMGKVSMRINAGGISAAANMFASARRPTC